MNHIIYNISIMLIFFGAIMLTYNLTKSYNKCSIMPNRKKYDEFLEEDIRQLSNQDRPSQIFSKMFEQSDTWMGYADLDVKGIQNKLI